jgi:hypothetical protein
MSGSVHLSRMFVAKTAWRLTGCAVLDMQAAGRMRIIFPLPPFWPSSSSSTSSWVPYAWRSVVEVGWNHMPKPAFACCRLAGFHAYRIQVQHPLRYVACWCAGVQQDCFLEILSLSAHNPLPLAPRIRRRRRLNAHIDCIKRRAVPPGLVVNSVLVPDLAHGIRMPCLRGLSNAPLDATPAVVSDEE